MMHRGRIVLLLIAVLLACGILLACSGGAEPVEEEKHVQVEAQEVVEEEEEEDVVEEQEVVEEEEEAPAPAEEVIPDEEEEVVAEEEEAVIEHVAELPAYEYPEELSFAAAEIVNTKYDFSFMYPRGWLATTTNEIYAAKAPSQVTGLWISAWDVAEGDTLPAILTAKLVEAPVEILRAGETTLEDGTTAYAAEYNATIGGWPMHCYSLGVIVGDNWITVNIWDMDTYAQFDGTLFAEIAHTLQVPADRPSPAGSTEEPGPNEYIVIAQLNLWYYGPGCYGGFEAFDCSGKRTTSLTPALGYTYDSADPAVIYQQIEWAVECGVDAFSIEWTTPRGIPGSIEENLDDAFLMAPNLHKIRWCIFYDFVLRLQQTPGLDVDISQGIDFNDPDVYDIFVSDFGHFAEKYFGHPQYLSVDGRPIIYVWVTWNFKGDFATAVQEARDSVAAHGYDVFIVGDEIRADTFDSGHAAVWDANTTFTPLIPGMGPWPAHVGEVAIAVDGIFESWRDNIQGLKVVGRDDYVNFQPAWAPQFDNRLFDLSNPWYVPARSKDDVIAMAEVARKYAEPVGSKGERFVWLNTWNCWAETTTFEPTAASGPKYPAGNYQFDMLEVVAEVFGTETFYHGD